VIPGHTKSTVPENLSKLSIETIMVHKDANTRELDYNEFTHKPEVTYG